MQIRLALKKYVPNAIHYTWNRIAQETSYHKSIYFVVALIPFLGHPFYYYIWKYVIPQPYENIPIRVIGSLICLPLLLLHFWPKSWLQHQQKYWFFVMTFNLPFFFTFMVLFNEFSFIPGISMLIACFLMVILFEWFSLIITFSTGVILAILFYILGASQPSFPLTDGSMFIVLYAFTMLSGAALNYKKGLLEREKMAGIAATTGIIAHELRTPLLSIKEVCVTHVQ